MYKKWEFYDIEEKKINQIAQDFQISNLLATVLVNRGITEKEQIQTFLNPTRSDFHDPFLMNDMEKAVERIITAIEKQEKVMIYGDYDVDGITSISVLKKFLAERGLNTDYYIPNRLEEGYGLNKKAVEKIANKQYQLMITVDCGISAIEEIKMATSYGIETIVTDHHEPLETLPEALAIIDSKRKDNTYPFKNLAGVGVVFKLIQAIGIKLGLPEKEYLKYLDIVCIGTISDIVPLVDENRVIAKLGLKLVEVTKNPGLKTLLISSGYKVVNSNTISFGIAPRINACGRMGFEKEALKLILTENYAEAVEITERLNAYNRRRQEIEKRIFDEAIAQIEAQNLEENDAIILASSNWHHGVIGIVASKITDMYYKPCILICLEDGIGKGSGRSVPGFDLHKALCSTSEYLEKYGGHEMAVGLSLQEKNFEGFKKAFNQITRKSNIKEFIPVIKIDQELTQKDFRSNVIEELKQLEPFGEANKVPTFLYRNLRIDSIRSLSDGKHLKLTLKDGNFLINAIGFNMGKLVNEFLIGDKIDVVGILEINQFNGREMIQMNIKDMMRSLS